MFEAFLLSFGVIFVAELGDKSQLLALAFATRYRPWVVLAGITAATALTHIASVAIGASLGSSLPGQWIIAAAGIAMIAFGFWTLRGDSLGENDTHRVSGTHKSVFLAVFSAFLLAEIGDKTMLATISLGTHEDVFGTWLGSTIGMVAADGLAILIGATLGRKLPTRGIAIAATVGFFILGGLTLADGVRSGNDATLTMIALCLFVLTIVAGTAIVVRARRADASASSTAGPRDTVDGQMLK